MQCIKNKQLYKNLFIVTNEVYTEHCTKDIVQNKTTNSGMTTSRIVQWSWSKLNHIHYIQLTVTLCNQCRCKVESDNMKTESFADCIHSEFNRANEYMHAHYSAWRLPPVVAEDGSTANTATLCPWDVSNLPSASIWVLLPAPGGPDSPTIKYTYFPIWTTDYIIS